MTVDEVPSTQADLQIWYNDHPLSTVSIILNIGGNFLIIYS